jgi:hypothetical protein
VRSKPQLLRLLVAVAAGKQVGPTKHAVIVSLFAGPGQFAATQLFLLLALESNHLVLVLVKFLDP